MSSYILGLPDGRTLTRCFYRPGSYPRLCSGPSNTIINETYYKPLYYTLKAHKLDGIDLDIEERVSYTCPLALLRRLNQDFGPNFITTMSPVASELQSGGYGK